MILCGIHQSLIMHEITLNMEYAEKGIKHRLIIEITNENIDKINSFTGLDKTS